MARARADAERIHRLARGAPIRQSILHLTTLALLAGSAVPASAQAITSTDTNDFVTRVFGGGSTFDGTVLTGPTYTVGSQPYYTIGDTVAALDSRIDIVGGVAFFDAAGIIASFAALEEFYTDVELGRIGLVQQDATTRAISVGLATDGTSVSFNGTSGNRVLTGVADGLVSAASVQAINGGQLYSSNEAIAAALGTSVGADGNILAPSYALSTATYNNVNSALLDLDGRTAQNTTDITEIINGTTGLVRQDPTSRVITIGGQTDGDTISLANQSGTQRRLTGVAAGAVGAASQDAVNGSQLSAVSTSIVSALGGGSTVAGDGTVTAPSFTVLSQSYSSVGAAFGAIDTALGNIESNSLYFAAQTTRGLASASAPETVAAGGGASASATNAVAVGSGANASGSGSIALGALASASGTNAIAIGNGAVASAPGQVALGGPDATYRLAGISSDQSLAAQEGPVEFVTSDASGNLATMSMAPFFDSIDALDDRVDALEDDNRSMREGVAIALALGGVQLPADKTFALSANVGMFEEEAALGFGAIGQVSENVYLNGGVGFGTSHGTVAGRVGASFAW